MTSTNWPSWYHVAAALVSAGLPDAEAGDLARKAFLSATPLLVLRAAFDDLETEQQTLHKRAGSIRKVILANTGHDGEAFVRAVVEQANP